MEGWLVGLPGESKYQEPTRITRALKILPMLELDF